MNDTWTRFAVTAALVGAFSASTVAGTVAQRPLFLGGATEPNIMFLLDSSGSMNNIVPDAPFDATVSIACADSNKLDPANGTVLIQIDGGGDVSFQVGSNSFDWGNPASADSSTKCFGDADTYMAALNASDTSSRPWKPGSYLPAMYSGRYLNWYFGSGSSNWGTSATRKPTTPGTQSRAEIAQGALVNLLPSLAGTRVGLATYNGGDGAMIEAAVAPVSSSATVSLTSAINSVSFSGSTPLAESLHQIGHYFIGNTGTASAGSSSSASCTVNGQYNGDLVIHPSGASSTVSVSSLFPTAPAYPPGVSALESPICYFCQQNFAILLTDGRATSDDNIPAALRDYDGDCSGGNAGNCEDSDISVSLDRKTGASYAYESLSNGGSDYLDDVAQALHEIDLRPDINQIGGGGSLNNLTTYVIGFADSQVLDDQLLKDTAAQGGGQFLTASNAGELITKFQQAVGSIASQVSSGTGIATTAAELKTDLLAFTASFNTGDWTGELLARPVASDGSLSAPVWNAAASSSIPAHGSRGIYSWDPSTRAGFAFTAANAAAINAIAASAGAASLTDPEINYLRGDQSNELPSGTFRQRSKLLGDIINSDPLFVTASNFGFARLPEGAADANSPYGTFLDTLASKPDMVYVGANDAMLHGYSIDYDATNNTASGTEHFGFIPTAVYGGLASLASSSYVHRYYVDGAPTFSHAYIDPAANGGNKDWRVVLAGTTGAGGSGVFALDITDPANFGAGNVLWDIHAGTDTLFADLGFTIGQVSIARMKNGHFYAVFGNGYGSSSGSAVLYLVRLDDPDTADSTKVIKLDTQTSNNGMSSPLVVDSNGDRIADAIYAGDLQGNLWKVDVDNTNPAAWDFAHTAANAPAPLFTARSNTGAVQPITAKPEARKHPNGGLMLLFGTGQFFEEGDNIVASPVVQSFYGIRDHNGQVVVGDRTNGSFALVEQKIFDEQDVGSVRVRATTDHSVNPASDDGWFMDLWLQEPSVTPVALGERVIDKALLRGDRVVFTTITPVGVPCAGGGTSWLMELDAIRGSRLAITPFDVNGDGLYDSNDYITTTDPDTGVALTIPVSGIQDTALGITGGAVTVVDASNDEKKLLSGSTGVTRTIGESDSGDLGRQSWQQLR